MLLSEFTKDFGIEKYFRSPKNISYSLLANYIQLVLEGEWIGGLIIQQDFSLNSDINEYFTILDTSSDDLRTGDVYIVLSNERYRYGVFLDDNTVIEQPNHLNPQHEILNDDIAKYTIWAESKGFKVVWMRPLNQKNISPANIIRNININVKEYGAVGDGVTDDTVAITAALTYIQGLSKKPQLDFPAGTYLTSSPLPMFSGMAMSGATPTDEFGYNTQILNTTTDMFNYTTTVTGMKLVGITFRGSISCTTKFVNNNADPSQSIFWSKIYDCGFNFFNKTTMTLTGVVITHCYFNNAAFGGFEFKGSDNMISENFFAVNNTSPATYSAVYLTNFDNSRFTQNYITGWKNLPLNITSSNELFITENWIDESDVSGIYAINCKSLSIASNRFKNLLRIPSGVHINAITTFDVFNLRIINNTFQAIPSNMNNIGVRNSSQLSDSIYIAENVTYDALTRNYNFDDAVTNITINDPILPIISIINGSVAPSRASGIRGRTYANTSAATANCFLSLPKALPGNSFRAVRGSATYYIRVIPQSTENFRGLPAATSQQLNSVGASFYVQCVEAGVWDIISSSGTIV